MPDDRAEVLARFLKDTAAHELEVLLDNGLHRHMRFRRPGTGVYGFDIVTWPGYLAISGDMGASLFTRLPDMLEFFRGKPDGDLVINPAYWAEKCVANDGEKQEFRMELLRAYVKEHYDAHVAEHRTEDNQPPAWAADLWEEIEDEVLNRVDDYQSTTSAIQRMDEFEPAAERYERYRFVDAWESASSLETWTFQFVWRLYAIAHAVRAYDAQLAPSREPRNAAAAVQQR